MFIGFPHKRGLSQWAMSMFWLFMTTQEPHVDGKRSDDYELKLISTPYDIRLKLY